MRKYIFLLLISILLLAGCSQNNESSNIESISVGGYYYKDASDILNKVDSKETIMPTLSPTPSAIPFKCNETEYKTYLAINKIRKDNNLNELNWDDNLYDSILIRAKEISEEFSHTRPDGSSCFTVSKQLHGENIAKGYTSVDKVVEGWMNSPGHKENILRKDFKRTAIGYYKNSSDTYWCQGFGY